jgi:hypothetical protein
MHRQEANQLANCVDCGAEISAAMDRSYASGGIGVLCWECAVRRGGSYDAERDEWSVSPELWGLEPEDFEAP